MRTFYMIVRSPFFTDVYPMHALVLVSLFLFGGKLRMDVGNGKSTRSFRSYLLLVLTSQTIGQM